MVTLESAMIPIAVLIFILYGGAVLSKPVDVLTNDGEFPFAEHQPLAEGNMTELAAMDFDNSSAYVIDFMYGNSTFQTGSTEWAMLSVGLSGSGDSTNENKTSRMPPDYTTPSHTTAFMTSPSPTASPIPRSRVSAYPETRNCSPCQTTPTATTIPPPAAVRFIWPLNRETSPSPPVPVVSHPETASVTTGTAAASSPAWKLQCELSYRHG